MKHTSKTITKDASTIFLIGLLIILMVVSGILFFRLRTSNKNNLQTSQIPTVQIPTYAVATPTKGIPPTVAVMEENKVKVYEAIVNMTEAGYEPSTVEIAVGGQVKFVNTSDTVKTPVVFGEDGSEIVSLPVRPNLNLTQMFDKVGVYTFGDKNNPEVKGSVKVVE